MTYTKVLLALVTGISLLSASIAAETGVDNRKRGPYLDSLKGKRVVFLPVARGIDLVEAWLSVMQKQAKELGYTLEVRDPNWSTDAGARVIEDITNKKPDLFIVHNPDVQSYVRLLKTAQDAGVKILQLNMESAYATDAYVGADWVGIGEQLGQALVDHCGAGKGPSTKVAIMLGVPTGAADVYQLKGMSNVLAKHPEIKVVSQQATGYDASKANSIMTTVLQQNPDLCGAAGIWDSMDVGTGSAVMQAGKAGKVFVVTSGGGSQTSCENIQRGIFSMYLSYNAPLQGALVNQSIADLLQTGGKAGATKLTYFSPTTWLTKSNLTARNCWSLDDLK